MNDIELAGAISPEIASLLTLAKTAVDDYPGYSLINLRALCKQVCKQIIAAKKLAIPQNEDVAFLIKEISDRLKLDQASKHALHALREYGNKGAHPEQYRLEHQRLHELACEALEFTVTSLRVAHHYMYPGQQLPAQIDIALIGDGLKTLSHQATIEEQPEAQYLMGKYFMQKADDALRNLKPLEIDFSVSKFEHKAHYWFELAADQMHPQAMYEHARQLMAGMKGDDRIFMGVSEVFRAAEFGNTDANAYLGQIYYEGLYEQPQDFVEARKHFELAAADDHPAALMMLGVMYESGKGGPANPQAAFEYTRRSAEAGYPSGQYNLFVCYWNASERNEAEAIAWLHKAAEQNFPDALNILATLIEEGRIAGKTLEDARHLFERSMHSPFGDASTRNHAAFLRARLLATHYDDLRNLTSAADSLQRCFEAEQGSSALAEACAELSPMVISNIHKLILARNGSADEIHAANWITQYMFDKNGRPLAKRNAGLKALGDDLKNAMKSREQLAQELYQARLARAFYPELSSIKGQLRLRAVPNPSDKTGRNEPCPCRSGKKYKKCCGK